MVSTRAQTAIPAIMAVVAVIGAILGGGQFQFGLGTDPWLPVGTVIEKDIAYGEDPAQRFDVYRPATAEDSPIILMVHGGGWRGGDKATHDTVRNKAGHYVGLGYVLISTNYRMGDLTPPEEALDVAAALAYVQQHAAQWGGDSEKLVLMGHSAGANLSALITVDRSFWQLAGVAPWLGTVALDSGAYDVPTLMAGDHDRVYDTAFGTDEKVWHTGSPTLNVWAHPLPMMLVCGTTRHFACPQADGLAAALEAQDGEVSIHTTDLTHNQLNHNLGLPSPLTDAVDDFLGSLGLPN